ncbi:MAG: FAD-dependent oxidoreductase [Okeania sp. SIO3I5]|uniref:flavin monoamine oxidase family protein n=1 Tax=Okeania sp. SIO3I5 TaxID=2607805 RepID=UPI0013BC4594|nr:FAD-dependent oxidoreductase [Okeania sp. SIO3I5]NEQ40663.1 FAD-dependent oxidoreductase [Okeania sp. SIO3I5]
MAKSSLMKMLRRAYGIANTSRKTGIPTDELLGMLTETKSRNFRTTRRRLLQGGLGFAGAMAASNFFKGGERAMAQTTPILIVGAGIAGLTAAYRLTQAGVPVNVIEARNRLGGRIRSISKIAGTTIDAELGGAYIDTDNVCIRDLAAELGLTEFDLVAGEQGLTPELYFADGRIIPIQEIINDFAPVAERIDADLIAIDNFEDYTTFDQPTADIDNLSIAEYLETIPTSTTLRQLLGVAYNAFYGLDAQEQSSLNLIYVIGTEPNTFELYGSLDERYRIVGGNSQIINNLANFLQGSIETSTVLEAITSLSDGSYRVSLRSGESTFDRTYERILLTIPFPVLRQVQLNVDLPPVKRFAIDNYGFGTNSKLHIAFNNPVWRTRFGSSGESYADLGFQNTREVAPTSPTTEGVLEFLAGGNLGLALGSGTPEDNAQRFLPELDLLYPGISNDRIGRAVRSYWPGELYTQGSYTCYRPGQYVQFFGVEGERVGNLFFAGEHTSLDFSGLMEGGCESGEIAAMEILEDLGLAPAVEALRIRQSLQEDRRGSRPQGPNATGIRRKQGLPIRPR